MSHPGLKILYFIINNIPYASAERVFAPWLDLESYLRHNSLPITSLESKRPLKDFDIVGFTLQYELSYTNILNMLDLGGIPIRSADRKDRDPIIIAGGPCAVNPIPLAPFIDAFVIGDGEEIIEEIIKVCSEFKAHDSGYRDKDSLLKALSELKGVYVPSVHSIGSRQKIKKRIVKNLDKAMFPESPIVPYAPIIHDRIQIEVSRGCTKGCRFCQAGMIYRPLRERSLKKVLTLAKNSIANTGYEEISFTSLSTGDYPELLNLLRIFNSCSNYPVAVSLPSLRVGTVNSEVLKEIKSIRRTGFTIAPEAGTERLRNVINKDFKEEDYEETLNRLFREGWQNLKLYFMIGLPTETEGDIEGIIRMVETAVKRGKEIVGGRVNINIGVSAFVPKPHTPFQWLGQLPYKELRIRQDFLRKALRRRGLNFKGQHIEFSIIESVFARGDISCASLLETAWRLGCRFDGWSESFNFNNWLSAAEKTGIDLYKYAERTMDIDSELPWDLIDIGITKRFLKSEYEKSTEGETTPDCRELCSGCGLECNSKNQNSGHRSPDFRFFIQSAGSTTLKPSKTATSFKMRVKFSKGGILRYLSHREVMTAIIRAIHRADVPLVYSKGFHPHPRISFGPPLPVGVEGISEYFDIELPVLINPYRLLSKINSSLPDGLRLLSVAHLKKNKKPLNEFISRYEYKITIDKTMHKSINSFIELTNCMVKRGEKEIDIRAMVEKAEVNDGILDLILVDTNNKVRLYEILEKLFQLPLEKIHSIPICRTSLYGYSNKKGWVTPLEDL
jgi:radical SAM family uncharacterized protein/radical SAM-linked protein